ncbi:MAG: DUF4097 family beta strand repeat protein [Candidatus Hydrogenedens sp.]|nr:DUF4097 family beta strand repeat protein [Candidatus Hydrogenedens sp.]
MLMKTLSTGIASAALVCGAAAASLESAQTQKDLDVGRTRATEVSEQTLEAHAGGAVSVDNVSGAIRVVGWDQPEVRLVVTKTLERYTNWLSWLGMGAWSESDVQATLAEVRAEARWQGDTLEVTVDATNGDWPDGLTVDIELRVPRDSALDLEASNGAIQVEGIDAPVAGDTSNGAISLANVSGAIDAATTNGAIELSDIGGAVKARTTNGSIVCRDAGGAVDLNTVNGSIEAVHAGADAVRCTTGNGAIRLALAEPHGHELSLSTQTGHLRCDVPLDAGARLGGSTLEATLRGGGSLIELRSGNGSIEVAEL